MASRTAPQPPCASAHLHAMERPCESTCQSTLAATCSGLRMNAGVAQVDPLPEHSVYGTATPLICTNLLM